MSQYPESVIQALENIGLKIDDLPVLHLREDRDYIDFIRKSDVPEKTPIMRFTTESKRCGLAVRVQSRDGEIDGVLSFHNRYTSGGPWVRCGHDPEDWAVNPKYDKLHNPEHLDTVSLIACPLCPKFQTNQACGFLCDLLTGVDQVLIVFGRVNESPVVDWKTKFESAREHCLYLCEKISNLQREKNALVDKYGI